MDVVERARAVERVLEKGEGCSAVRLLTDLSPADRLKVLKEAVSNNHTNANDGIPRLDFSTTAPISPLTEADKLIWVTKQSQDKKDVPVKLIGFNDLTILPCKNAK
jgi:hypothetical protein